MTKTVLIPDNVGRGMQLDPLANKFHASSAYTGAVLDPNATPPTTAPIDGDTYIQTDTGTSSGIMLAEWKYVGGRWLRVNSIATPVAAVLDGGTLRTYHPSRTAFVPYFTVANTAATIAANGFTAVGGATLGNTGYGQRQLINCTAAQKANTAADKYTPPTSYVRHEIAVADGVDNVYFLSLQADWARSQLDVWVCDPTTGTPLERLATTDQSLSGGGFRWAQHVAPDNGRGMNGYYQEWLAHHIPASVVTARKTSAGTLKLAISPGSGHGGGTTFRIAGYAMATNPYGLVVSPAITHCQNIPHNGIYQDSASWAQWSGNIDNIAMCYVPDNGIAYARVPLASTDHDIYLMLPGRYPANGNIAGVECTIKHTSGDVALGRPALAVDAPYMRLMDGWSLQRQGFVIPASTLQAKAVKPTNSAISYLDLYMTNTTSNMQGHFAGFVTEYINP